MKDFISSLTRLRIAFLSVLLTILVSSCAHEPQRLLFSNHPIEYKKTEKSAPVLVAVPDAEVDASLAASTADKVETVLPENAYAQSEMKREALAAELIKNKRVLATPETSRIKNKEKITLLKSALKEVKKARKEIKQLKKADRKQVKAAGPVTNDVAIKIVVLGLTLVLLGLIVPFLYGLGGLVVVIGLVLLLLNYL